MGIKCSTPALYYWHSKSIIWLNPSGFGNPTGLGHSQETCKWRHNKTTENQAYWFLVN